MATKEPNLRSCIEEFSAKNTDYKFPEQAINQAESLKSLSIFDEKDLHGICGVNHGTKKKDLNKTGYKGLGFKAVFGKSNKQNQNHVAYAILLTNTGEINSALNQLKQQPY
ncbi:unnamed protein product, partial [Rotaria sordida]